MYSAYVTKVNKDLKKTLLEGLEFVNWKKHVKRDSFVFVKPNFTFPCHKKGVTTTPELIQCLLENVRNRSSKVVLGESDGGNHSFRAEDAFRGHLIYEICKEIGVEVVSLSSLPSKFVETEIQFRKVKVRVPKILLEKVDCFISVPVLKVHVMTGVSLGLKNLWGCHPDTMRCLEHRNLDHKLALLTKLLNPKITVVDGLYALDGHGPMFGVMKKLDLILISDNVVAADALGANMVGIPLKKAKHILIAEKEGLGTTNLESVKFNTDWRRYRLQFQTRKTLIDRASRLLFYSDTMAKFVMASSFSPLIYKVAERLRSPEEKAIASQLNTYKHYL